MMRSFARTVGACLAAALFLLAAPSARAEKGALTIGLSQYPATFHPSIEAMLAKSYVLAMTRRPFTLYGPDWKLQCMLCTEVPTIANGRAVPERTPNGKQGIAVTYTIRPDAQWGDGTPITTKDVLFTWEIGRHPESGFGNAELFRSLYRLEARDERTFTMHFDKLTFDYAAINDFVVLPEHVERANAAVPREYRTKTAYDTDTTNEALYFGPYLIAEAVRGSHVVLEPNPRWWGRKPAFHRIVVRAIENTAALEANLLSGSLDMIAGELGVTIDQAIAFQKRHGNRFAVVYKPGLIYEHIDLNLANPILADVRVRRALLHGVDREAISAQLFDGRQPVAHTSVSPLDWVHSEQAARYAFDPKRAAALLAEAGWGRMRNGIRANAAGEPLAFEFMTTAGNRTRELVQQALQSQWRSLGIDVRIRNEPARVFFGQTLSRRQFSALAMFAWVSSPENVPRTTLHSAEVPTATNNFSGQNYTGYANAEVDRLIDTIEVELDAEKRRGLWERLQQIYAEDLPALPLFFRADAFILPPWLGGIVPTGHQYPSTLWVEEWTDRR